MVRKEGYIDQVMMRRSLNEYHRMMECKSKSPKNDEMMEKYIQFPNIYACPLLDTCLHEAS